MCPAVNFIDASALESLAHINQRLADAGIELHLSEVKGPVMDRLKRTDFLEHLSGRMAAPRYSGVPRAASSPTAEAVMSDATATGPTARVIEVPKSV
jgi:SulP family sulfate permease